MTPLLFDAHLDLSINALEWNRDLRMPLHTIRNKEKHLTDKPGRGRNTVTLPEMRRCRLGICVATLLARVEHNLFSPVPGWSSPEQAWAMTQGQLHWYRAMEDAGEMIQIRDLSALNRQFKLWESATPEQCENLPIGYILSLEGADSLVTINHLERAWEEGLRAIGPAHYGPGIYAQGTDSEGPFPARGKDLLRACDQLGMILDVTHLSDACFWEALESYSSPIWASHHNSRSLVPHQRQLSDQMFLALTQRQAVVGVALDAWMLSPGWQRQVTTPQSAGLKLEALVDHIDHFCQLAGSAKFVGIGSDLDGCFGTEQTPEDLDSIADLQKLSSLLNARGYSQSDILEIMHGNFLRRLRSALPQN